MDIRLEHLSIGYKGREVVADDINIEIRNGELTCLIGQNGVGKSTLLKTISGLLPAKSGRVMIGADGDVAAMTHQQLAKRVGVVLTGRPDVQNLTVEEIVGLGRSPYTGYLGRLNDDDRRIVADVIGLVGITRLKDRMIQSLSDGERQKTMIAKALAQQTPAILLDEPTSFLDFRSKVDMFRLLQDLAHKQDKLILLSTHDLELAVRLSDRLVELNENGIHIVEADHVKAEIRDLLF